jgi:hypothetical protein
MLQASQSLNRDLEDKKVTDGKTGEWVMKNTGRVKREVPTGDESNGSGLEVVVKLQNK